MSQVSHIDQAFFDQPDLRRRIYNASLTSTEFASLLDDIAKHINTLKGASTSSNGTHEPAAKKRRLDSETVSYNHAWSPGTFSVFHDISFFIPNRKKYRLEIGTSKNQGIRTINLANGEIDIFASWSDIHAIACLPVPDKAHPYYSFCFFTKNTEGGMLADQMLFTIMDAVPKRGTVQLVNVSSSEDTYRTLFLSVLNKGLAHSGAQVSEPSSEQFCSKVPQAATRKGGKAYDIKAFRGAKDGYLFLLSIGIVWGFKKPLEFFPFDVIQSVSYTYVLQRTFNLNIAVKDGAGERELEFSMLDQAEFEGVDVYIKRYGLQDASLAEQRRAKKYNVNGGRREKGDEAEESGDEGTELQKAAREAVDGVTEPGMGGDADEDEDEEDDENFDPGSEGESEGEGSESEDEEADGGGVKEEDDDDDDDDDE